MDFKVFCWHFLVNSADWTYAKLIKLVMIKSRSQEPSEWRKLFIFIDKNISTIEMKSRRPFVPAFAMMSFTATKNLELCFWTETLLSSVTVEESPPGMITLFIHAKHTFSWMCFELKTDGSFWKWFRCCLQLFNFSMKFLRFSTIRFSIESLLIIFFRQIN